MQRFTYNPSKVSENRIVMGIVYIKNGCCEDQPVLITANYNSAVPNHVNYSCQCGCGMWCTTGHPTPVGALKDYQTMSNGDMPSDDDYAPKH